MDGAALVAKVFDAFDRSADGYLDRGNPTPPLSHRT